MVLVSDIADDPKFNGLIAHNQYFDCQTPYGYGGPLSDGSIPQESQDRCLAELSEYAGSHGWVSQFVRFHPLLGNHEIAPRVFETKYVHDTIFIDTSSPELIAANMDSTCRNKVRKALKNGVTIERSPIEDYSDFIPVYRETMNRDNAVGYYYFDEAFFKLQSSLRDNACIFYAKKDGQTIAASIMYFNDRYMHYHLSGSLTEFRKVAPVNLLLYEAACWASQRGIKQLHLGGGMTQDDALFEFKKQFNRNGRLPFVIGRTVFDDKKYRELMNIRMKNDWQFDGSNPRMIQYRA